ncbi:PilW family protein [Methylotetracoccus oryzae]|uniref:PilW family protein n=1 Tax=Methylotetracoccus oryzae TaxID=1919059 RepID=UPI00111AA1E3|nr:PilW family protein [Methylotetracoccus oryzae]
MTKRPRPRRQSGLSLIELMIALTLGLLVTLALSGVYLGSREHYHQAERFARMQDAGRFALDVLVHDLSLADFWGGFSTDVSGGPGIALSADCGPSDIDRWAYDVTRAVEYFKPSSPSDAPSTHFGCLQDGDSYSVRGGANVLAVKHVAGSCVSQRTNKDGNYVCDTQAGQAGHVYVRVDGEAGSFILSSGGAPPTGVDPTASPVDWDYTVRVYYIATDDATGIPSLRRKGLTHNGGTPAIEEEGEIAEGVEFFHVQFGVDDLDLSTSACDADTHLDRYVGESDVYKSANHPLECALNARIYVLVRSLEPDSTLPLDDKTYQFGTINVSSALTGNPTFNDHYQRRVYTTTVQLRNPVYQNAFNMALPK